MISSVSCMTPLLIYLFLKIFLWNWESPPICLFETVIPFICLFLMHSWSAVNPCICFIFSKNYRNGLKQCFYCNYLNRRISGLQEKYRMQTTTSSYGDSSPQTHSSSVHFVSYSRKAWGLYIPIYMYNYLWVCVCVCMYVFKSLYLENRQDDHWICM